MTAKQQVIEDTNKLMEEKLSDDVERSKFEEYESLQEQFIDDEISEDELETGLDNLMESGDDFLERADEEPTQEVVSDETKFRLREVGQVIAVFGTIGLTVYVLSATNGFIIPLLIPIILLTLFWKAGLID